MKKLLALIATSLLAIPLAQAQTETGTSAGQMALDEARSQPISAGGPTVPATVTVVDGKSMNKEVVVVEEDDKWWSVNASTGWDSLYMFRGVNVLGNGNGIYWIGGGFGVTPWENGEFTANVWYGVGSWWNASNPQTTYGELDVSLGYSHSFGPLTLSTGWIYYFFPNTVDAFDRIPTSQNEFYFGAAYDIEIGSVTLTPNSTYYFNVGPEWGKTGGFANAGSSYWNFGLSADVPVAFDGAVSLAPYTMFGLNFGFNNRASTGKGFIGGNNLQMGVALPVQFTSWFSISPYVAYSYQWSDLQSFGAGQSVTDENTWWAGVSASLSY